MDHFFTESFPDPDPSQGQPVTSVTGQLKLFLMDLLQTLVLAALLYLGINAISARIRVQSISMQPTLYEQDFVIVNKLAYRLGSPSRGDIIVFQPPMDPGGEPYIKRVIGLPGDTVKILDGKVYVNEVLLQESYIKAPTGYRGTWIVPADDLFVLGDNRNNSADSHQWGMLPLKNVIGKAEVVYYPISHWQILNPATAAAAGP